MSDPVARGAAGAVLATTSLSALLVFGSAAALGVAVPSMATDLAGGRSTASWMVPAFLLANSATILVFGKLSDSLGRRALYLGGLAVFTAGSVVCTVVTSDGLLVAARVAQGLAAAAAVSNTTAVLGDVFPPPRLPLALSLNITAGGSATLLGPLVGGLLVNAFGWRSIFVCTVPVGVLAVGTGWWSLRYAHSPGRAGALALSTALVLAVVLGTPGEVAGYVVTAATLGITGLLAALLAARRANRTAPPPAYCPRSHKVAAGQRPAGRAPDSAIRRSSPVMRGQHPAGSVDLTALVTGGFR